MITTIYNILNILFTSYLAYIGDVLSLKIYYTVLCIGALFIAYRIDQVVIQYPAVGSQFKEGVEFLFGEEFRPRLINYIGSFICHLAVVSYMIQNIPLTIAISAVFIFRMTLLINSNKKVKAELSK